jgi:hypothetical protein
MIWPLSQRLERIFWQLTDETPEKLAKDVVRLSDFYLNNKGSTTPWKQAGALQAYAVYFLPLNTLRLQAAWHEVQRFIAAENIEEIWDFGSGLGATHWMLEEQEWLTPRKLVCLESDRAAVEQHRTLIAKGDCKWRPEFNVPVKPGPKALAVFSYSFLEMQSALPNLEDFAHILIVEPSFKETGRALMQWRQRWIEQGLTPLAPCTHSLACPLLTHSPSDWCHHRIHVEGSPRFNELQRSLPMKNQTITFSYLLLSNQVAEPAFRGATRVIGDTLYEKGKVRQLMCRGPEREFLAWLTRNGEPPMVPHGSIIEDLGEIELKGNEVRVQKSLNWVE